MNRKCFKMTEKEKVLSYLRNQKIDFDCAKIGDQDLVKIWVGTDPICERVIFNFGKKKSVDIESHIDKAIYENVDHIEIGWKDKNFSLRLFNDRTDLVSYVFYRIKRI